MPSLKARIQITNKCENNCWYCYVKKENKQINLKLFTKIIKKLNKIYENGKYSRFKIALTGGDPFSSDVILKCTDIILNELKGKPKQIHGEFCNKSNVEIAKKYLDMGIGETTCVFSLNEDPLDEILEKKNQVKPLSLLYIPITKYNYERLDSIIEIIVRQNLIFRLNHIYDPTNKYELLPIIEKTITEVFDAITNTNYTFPVLAPMFGCMNVINKNNSYCGYGENYFFFDINGNVSRCHLEKPITNIDDDNLEQTIKFNRDLINCYSCNSFDLCRGGCNYTNQNKLYCDLYKKISDKIKTFYKSKNMNYLFDK